MSESPPALAAGTKLGEGGRYEIRRRVGVGGMAEVYRAVDTRLAKRDVAVKTLAANMATHRFAEKMRQLFIQEAQALSLIEDDNVVDVHDFGVTADGTPYMVMEYLRGVDLGVFLRRTKSVTVQDAVDMMMGVCAGVHACHMAGIIHRDLKPANIFLARTLKGEQIKVLDFSVAKAPVAREGDKSERSRTDLIVGTPSYMAPEQALGQPATERSDQYSIGALLYRCLIGRPPQGIAPRPREARPEIPGALEDAILRALDPNPERRFATVHELGHSLWSYASLPVRERWKSYYHAPPQPFDASTTGSLSRESVRPRPDLSPPAVPPTVVDPGPDAEAHDRTTKIDPGLSPPTIDPAAFTTSTVLDGAGVDVVATDSISDVSVDVPLSSLSTGASSGARPGPVTTDTAPSTSAALGPISSRFRRRILVGFVAGGVLVVGLVVAMGLRISVAARGAAGSSPTVLRAPAAVASPPAAAPDRAAPPQPPAPALLAPAPEVAAIPSKPDSASTPGQPVPASGKRPRRHRAAGAPAPTLQYGEGGMPILR